MPHLTYLVIAIAALQISSERSVATAGDGTNAAPFRVLCNLVNLAQANLAQQLPQITLSDGSLKQMEEIYITVSNPDWEQKFPDAIPLTDPDPPQKGCQEGSEQPACLASWTKWTAAKDRIKKTQEATRRKFIDKNVRTQTQGKRTAAKISKMLKLAEAEYDRYTKEVKQHIQPDGPNIKSNLDEALFGVGATKKDGTDEQSSSKGGSRTLGCKGTNVGKSLLGDLLCLCVVTSEKTDVKPCGFDTSDVKTQSWTAITGDHQKNAWETFKEQCAKLPQQKLSAAAIRAALAAFDAALKGATTADIGTDIGAFLGEHSGQDCGAAGNAAKCVDYSKVLNLKGAGNNQLTWYIKMAAAADAIEERQRYIREAQAIEATLQRVATDADVLYEALTVTDAGQTQQAVQEKVAKQDCDKHNTNQTCTKANCKLEEKDGKGECKPRQGIENTPTAAMVAL
uniref:Variant surface glycoprotein 1125.1221 n=1 Tax=Trypanosoma brucei TaxID=5691 RepID=A0A1J0R6S6_9TRYP|nr:variant surface glycoprotein 1125.1221 [Trypanosoma brucei]